MPTDVPLTGYCLLLVARPTNTGDLDLRPLKPFANTQFLAYGSGYETFPRVTPSDIVPDWGTDDICYGVVCPLISSAARGDRKSSEDQRKEIDRDSQ